MCLDPGEGLPFEKPASFCRATMADHFALPNEPGRFAINRCTIIGLAGQSKAVLRIARAFFTVLLVSVGPVVMGAAIADAEDRQVTPYIGIEQQYSDNVNFSAVDPIDDAVTLITPGIRMRAQSEITSAAIEGYLVGRYYRDQRNADHIDKFASGTINHRFTPRTSAGISAGFDQTSSPDRDIEETGIVVGGDVRNRYVAGATGNYALSEMTSMTGGYNYSLEEYDNPSLNTTRTHAVNMGISALLDRYLPSTTGQLTGSYAVYDYASDQPAGGLSPQATINRRTQTQSASLTMGITKALTEAWKLDLSLGPAYVTTNEETTFFLAPSAAVTRLTVSGWQGVGAVGVSYAATDWTFSANLSHDIGAPSATTTATARTSAGIQLSRRFSREITAGIHISYIKNTADNTLLTAADTDRGTFIFRPHFRYDFSRDTAFEAGYSFSYERDHIAETAADQNRFYFSVSVQWPLMD